MTKSFAAAFLSILFISPAVQAQNGGELFYLSGNGIKAETAEGNPNPNILDRVSVVPDGKVGNALRAHYRNAWSYLAPGNIYSDRGTVAFWWRSGEPLTETAFPLWRVAFADHTSWDMVWMRIDWNGEGFDAFVTDNSCARVRVHTKTAKPAADEWIHVAFSWDESKGVRLYLNGKLSASKDAVSCLNTGLDQFGPHQRIVSPYQVQSAYIIQRGGDLDELHIYDHMLSDGEIADISDNKKVSIPEYKDFDSDGWKRFFGFDKSLPPYLKDKETSVRKVQISDCFDYKRWFWKACDGLRETTWPGVYNRSRLEGRDDYFHLPDWDCYSFSGKDVRFVMAEPWNYLEITGAAYGKVEGCGLYATKDKGTQRSFIKSEDLRGKGELVFTNEVQETPIQEFNAFKVTPGKAPRGYIRLSYGLGDFCDYDNPMLTGISRYIDGRFRKGERSKLLAMTWSDKKQKLSETGGNAPVAHIIIPSDCRELDINVPPVMEEVGVEALEFGKTSSWHSNKEESSWAMVHAGLDGICISIPGLKATAVKDGLIPMNIAVMDPLDPVRYMMDFSFCVKPAEARTLWLDLRDRILPADKPLYVRISSGSPDFRAEQLQGTKMDLVFKKYAEAKAEHVEDRFNQVRDNYAVLVEEATNSRRYSKYRRYENDLADLLKVDPEHIQGLRYKNERFPATTPIEYVEPQAPDGVPEWAFLQLEYLRRWKYLAQWYLDNRQAPNGEFGGGLSDDSTFTGVYVGIAEGGIMKERSIDAIKRSLQAIYDNGMLTHGVSTIQSDGLHAFEEGEITIGQAAMVSPSDPLVKARLLESAHQSFKTYFGKNEAGHWHLKGDYYGYGIAAIEGPWGWSSKRGNFHICPSILAAVLYKDKESINNIGKYYDSLFAHAQDDGNGGLLLPGEINFKTDQTRLPSKGISLLLARMWEITGDERCLKAAEDITTGMKGMSGKELSKLYRPVIRSMELREWYNTHGSPYIDRVRRGFTEYISARIGGAISSAIPWNLVSWTFKQEEDAEKVAINVDYDLKNDWFDVEFFNTANHPVTVDMTGRRAADGNWLLTTPQSSRKVRFGLEKSVRLEIPAGKSWTIKMRKD